MAELVRRATNWRRSHFGMGFGALLASIVLVLLVAAGATSPLRALEAIAVTPEAELLEVGVKVEYIEGRRDNVQIQTAAGADGVKGRMSIRAATPGTRSRL